VRLKDRVCVITGATSGIGAATAVAFAKEGARLLLTGRDLARGERVVDDCRAAGAAEVSFEGGDVTDEQDVERVVQAGVDAYGRIDVLFANAGTIDGGTVLTTTPDQFRRVLDVNLTGQFMYARAVIPVMKAGGGGVIVNNASDWGLVAGPESVAYCCSKAGVTMLTKTLAVDHARDGIRCNAVCPGDTLTPMVLEARARMSGASTEEFTESAVLDVPLQRMAQPEEIAKVVVFLASDDSSFMTGSVVVVDGGNTCR
jgi:NAD(P)-dependent dehydrogenase (short-subunit alcohol dehydrogenase family)